MLTKDHREVVFRHCEASDAPAAYKFRASVAQESTHTMHYVGQQLQPVAEMEKRFAASVDDPLTLQLGVFAAGEVVGLLGFRPTFPDHPWVRHLVEFGMMTAQAYWGQGLGMNLLKIQEAVARRAGILRIEGYVRTRNERGVALYRRAGFEIEGTRRKAALIDGSFQDEYYIARLL